MSRRGKGVKMFTLSCVYGFARGRTAFIFFNTARRRIPLLVLLTAMNWIKRASTSTTPLLLPAQPSPASVHGYVLQQKEPFFSKAWSQMFKPMANLQQTKNGWMNKAHWMVLDWKSSHWRKPSLLVVSTPQWKQRAQSYGSTLHHCWDTRLSLTELFYVISSPDSS